MLQQPPERSLYFSFVMVGENESSLTCRGLDKQPILRHLIKHNWGLQSMLA